MGEDIAGSSARLESRSTRWAIGAFVIAAVVALLLTFGERVPLGGADKSVGNIAGWLSAVLAGAAFAASNLIEASRGQATWRARLPLVKRILDLLAMTAAMMMLSYLTVLAFAQLFQLGFRGLDVDSLATAVLSGSAAAALCYIAALAGARITSEGLAMLATGVLFLGTMASMLSSPDESWWQLHFSELGNTDGVTGYRFNLALMLAGLVVTVLANYIGHDLYRGMVARGAASRRLATRLTWIFAGIGVGLFIAGLVPDAVSFPVHVGAASGMVVMFGLFSFTVLRKLPEVPRDFVMFTIFVVIGILISIVLWVPIGYYNLTGMEFIAAGLLFAWLMVFVRMTAAYAAGSADAKVTPLPPAAAA